MDTRTTNERINIIWRIWWWLPTWFLGAWLLGWCAGQAACPAQTAPAGASTCQTTCPADRVCSGTECLYPCTDDNDCALIGDPRIPACSPEHVCVAGD